MHYETFVTAALATDFIQEPRVATDAFDLRVPDRPWTVRYPKRVLAVEVSKDSFEADTALQVKLARNFGYTNRSDDDAVIEMLLEMLEELAQSVPLKVSRIRYTKSGFRWAD